MKKIGLAGWLTIIFVIAKIAGFLSWSWLWVFSPLWISAGLVIISLLFVAMIAIDVFLHVGDFV